MTSQKTPKEFPVNIDDKSFKGIVTITQASLASKWVGHIVLKVVKYLPRIKYDEDGEVTWESDEDLEVRTIEEHATPRKLFTVKDCDKLFLVASLLAKKHNLTLHPHQFLVNSEVADSIKCYSLRQSSKAAFPSPVCILGSSSEDYKATNKKTSSKVDQDDGLDW